MPFVGNSPTDRAPASKEGDLKEQGDYRHINNYTSNNRYNLGPSVHTSTIGAETKATTMVSTRNNANNGRMAKEQIVMI